MKEEDAPLFSLSIESTTKAHLMQAARWARVLAVVGIVLLLIVLARTGYSLILLSRLSRGGTFVRAETLGSMSFFLLMTVVPLIAFIFLLRFANAMNKALSAEDQHLLNSSFQSLKVYFRYLGIVTSLIVVLIAVAFVLQLTGSVL